MKIELADFYLILYKESNKLLDMFCLLAYIIMLQGGTLQVI